jgi:hypothetical protein
MMFGSFNQDFTTLQVSIFVDQGTIVPYCINLALIPINSEPFRLSAAGKHSASVELPGLSFV